MKFGFVAKHRSIWPVAWLCEALGEPAMFAIGNRNETPECLVEQSVNAALEGTFAEAEALLLKRFSEITLADLAADFKRRHSAARCRAPRPAGRPARRAAGPPTRRGPSP